MNEHINNHSSLFTAQQKLFASGKTHCTHFRRCMLLQLKKAIKDNIPALTNALHRDLGKPVFLALSSEIYPVLAELNNALENLEKWASPRYTKPDFFLRPRSIWIKSSPYGTALILAPWNYPVTLCLVPLIGALAAGNTVILKPSEHAPHTASVIAKMLNGIFKPEYVHTALGDSTVSKALLELPVNYIFFTGGTAVGKLVMHAAAKNITPLTLELGGKCPALIDETADLEHATKRVIWAKYYNAGQSCIAPDYLLLKKELEEPFLNLAHETLRSFYGENPLLSNDYERIVNAHHFERLMNLMPKENTTSNTPNYSNRDNTHQAKLIRGGKSDASTLKIEPTLMRLESTETPLMQEEIFGPILPYILYNTLDQALEIVKQQSAPLALYLFSQHHATISRAINLVASGAVVINDALIQGADTNLSFGGVGASGFGRYHGKYSFDTFSYQRSFVKSSCWSLANFIYPPYGKQITKLLEKFIDFM